jgi:NAD(P)-dependent dehydrogenase (short-subunit alcohol dehydrogenase family)
MTDRHGELRGRVALVTGAGRGIGRAIAVALADAGAGVAVNDLTTDGLGETVTLLGDRVPVLPVAADVADRAAVERMIGHVERVLGPVDLLVNNAGIARPFGPLAVVDPTEWWRAIEIMLHGSFLCSHYALKEMLPRGRGRIVNVASNVGLWPWPNLSAYAVAKAALIRLTEQLSVECRERGIAAFAINPGAVRTAMTEEAATSPEAAALAPNVAQVFQRVFAASADVSAERTGRLVVRLATGSADALSGSFIDIMAGDDVDEMVEDAGRIGREELHRLRLRRYTQGAP